MFDYSDLSSPGESGRSRSASPAPPANVVRPYPKPEILKELEGDRYEPQVYSYGQERKPPPQPNALGKYATGMVIESLSGIAIREREEVVSPFKGRMLPRTRAEILELGSGPLKKRIKIRDQIGQVGWVSVVAENRAPLWRILRGDEVLRQPKPMSEWASKKELDKLKAKVIEEEIQEELERKGIVPYTEKKQEVVTTMALWGGYSDGPAFAEAPLKRLTTGSMRATWERDWTAAPRQPSGMRECFSDLNLRGQGGGLSNNESRCHLPQLEWHASSAAGDLCFKQPSDETAYAIAGLQPYVPRPLQGPAVSVPLPMHKLFAAKYLDDIGAHAFLILLNDFMK